MTTAQSKIDTYTIGAIRNLVTHPENRTWKRGNTRIECQNGWITVFVNNEGIAMITKDELILDTRQLMSGKVARSKAAVNRINAVLQAMYFDYLHLDSNWQWHNDLNGKITVPFNNPWVLGRTEF